MLFAKVTLGLPVEGPFDYIIPRQMQKEVGLGVRCIVPFRDKKMLGYVVGLSKTTCIKKLKSICGVVDTAPILSGNMLRLTREVAGYYFCSWGEAIETALPKALRSIKAIDSGFIRGCKDKPKTKLTNQVTLIHDLVGGGRWKIYLQKITDNLQDNRGVILLTPEIESANNIQHGLEKILNQKIAIMHSRQTAKESVYQWLMLKSGQVKIVVGTRLAIFSPLDNLGLIIIDNESDQSFKQDQTPHYNARDVAFMRAKLEKADLILGSATPSLEMYYLAENKKIEYIALEKKSFPEVRIVDLKQQIFFKKRSFLSIPLQNAISQALIANHKIIVFFNQKGFATSATCPNCGHTMLCPRCEVNLGYYYSGNRLICRYCNYKIEAPQICPNCKCAYIRYLGMGTEKIESELCRLYPKEKIVNFDSPNKAISHPADILVTTSFIFKYKPLGFDTYAQLKSDQSQDVKHAPVGIADQISPGLYVDEAGRYDLIAIISLDNPLNRIDFRASEKIFSMLIRLTELNPKKIILQTFFPEHYVFQAIRDARISSFYDRELGFRKELGFPPFGHLAVIKLRGRNDERVREQARIIFDKLKQFNDSKAIDVVSFFPGWPPKLRGNYYWQILIKSRQANKIRKFIKKHLKGFSRSGIIITVDMDPV